MSKHQRMVDGDGLWTSEKLRRMSPEFRAEYANCLPLAGANGTFEVDISLIWRMVYAYNREGVTVTTVEQIFHEFKQADLLRTWQDDGKVYGFWVGIDKEGRLPQPSHRKTRYKNDPPPPPSYVLERSAPVVEEKEFVSQETEEPVGAKKNIQVAALQIFGVSLSADPGWPEIAIMCKAYGEDKVSEAFETWAYDNADSGIRFPLTAFLKALPLMMSTSKVEAVGVDNAELDDLNSDLYTIGGNQAFSGKNLAALAGLLQNYSTEEIKAAYAEFVADKDSNSLRFAPKEFAEGGGKAVILARRKQKAEIQRQQDLMEKTEKVMLSEAATDLHEEEEPTTIELPEA
jgi:hypothetical protein